MKKVNKSYSSKPVVASQSVNRWVILFFIGMTILAVLVTSLTGCSKPTIPVPAINGEPEFTGKYVKIDTADYVPDTITAVYDRYIPSGVTPTCHLYHFQYPVFSTTCNFGQNSTTPIEIIKALDAGENHRDSLIETITIEMGVVSGRIKQDTLYLHVTRFSRPTVTYIYRKIQ